MYTPQNRYEQDAEFRALVDMLHSMIRQTKYTPTEIREAAMLAAVHFDVRNVFPRYKANPDGSVTVWDRTDGSRP